MVIWLLALAPGEMLTLAGVTPSVKLGRGVTVRAMVSVFVTLPDVPVILSRATPMPAFAAALNVIVAPESVAVTPKGTLLAVNATLPLNPFSRLSAIVLVPLLPC